MTLNTSTKLAYHLPTQRIIHIDKADNGLGCNCECTECHEKLEAAQGPIRDWYFRHDNNKNCKGGQETALHQLGKQILIDNNQIAIPKGVTIDYSDAIAEKAFYSTRPDVTAIYNGLNIYFEIAVNHFIEKDKESFFRNGQHKCVEIDLSKADTTSFENIKHLVLKETNNKKIFGWEQKKSEVQTGDNWFVKITIVALFLLFVSRLVGGRRR